jgi:hypothetical protein
LDFGFRLNERFSFFVLNFLRSIVFDLIYKYTQLFRD